MGLGVMVPRRANGNPKRQRGIYTTSLADASGCEYSGLMDASTSSKFHVHQVAEAKRRKLLTFLQLADVKATIDIDAIARAKRKCIGCNGRDGRELRLRVGPNAESDSSLRQSVCRIFR